MERDVLFPTRAEFVELARVSVIVVAGSAQLIASIPSGRNLSRWEWARWLPARIAAVTGIGVDAGRFVGNITGSNTDSTLSHRVVQIAFLVRGWVGSSR